MIRKDIDWLKLSEDFFQAVPFNHVIIDDFLLPEIIEKVSEEFPKFDDNNLNFHKNPLEDKRTMNKWDRFPPTTYKLFTYFAREQFNEIIKNFLKTDDIWFDYGLNGGGWHMHSRGGNNNIHLDYNVHPKLNEQRRLNIIIYATKNWKSEWGGGLELWSHDEEKKSPKDLIKVIENCYNRAIIFDTTQNSWHGLPNFIDCPSNVIRKSLAMYYVQPKPKNTEERGRALFAPRKEQMNDNSVLELIKMRSNVELSSQVYVKKEDNNEKT
jgi:Rps23 Pro-64 3,4-dihydroxylase Tpa1-like proline 4-hydroxylase